MIHRISRLSVLALFAIPMAANSGAQQKPNRKRGIVVLADSLAVHNEPNCSNARWQM
ncbi:MAG: hypothetical protein VX346_27580 [Planctomycetota bacterium]|nr:hypothetical protein [Planctomycetota bacterium]